MGGKCHLILPAATKDCKIVDIVKKEGLEDCFDKHQRNAFYALSKPELVQATKVMLAQKVSSDTWTEGAHKVRELLDLPEGNVKISPDDIRDGYRVFVQSTSWNRKIIKGTSIMLEVTQEQYDKYGEDGDTRNESETETIGNNKEKHRGKKRAATFDDDDTTVDPDETPAKRRKAYKEKNEKKEKKETKRGRKKKSSGPQE